MDGGGRSGQLARHEAANSARPCFTGFPKLATRGPTTSSPPRPRRFTGRPFALARTPSNPAWWDPPESSPAKFQSGQAPPLAAARFRKVAPRLIGAHCQKNVVLSAWPNDLVTGQFMHGRTGGRPRSVGIVRNSRPHTPPFPSLFATPRRHAEAQGEWALHFRILFSSRVRFQPASLPCPIYENAPWPGVRTCVQATPRCMYHGQGDQDATGRENNKIKKYYFLPLNEYLLPLFIYFILFYRFFISFPLFFPV